MRWATTAAYSVPGKSGDDHRTVAVYRRAVHPGGLQMGFWFDGSGRLVKGDTKVMHGLMHMDTGGWSHYENDLKQWLGKNAPSAGK